MGGNYNNINGGRQYMGLLSGDQGEVINTTTLTKAERLIHGGGGGGDQYNNMEEYWLSDHQQGRLGIKSGGYSNNNNNSSSNKENVMNNNSKKQKVGKGGNKYKLVACLTCLQFMFALYGTFLLYFMSPVGFLYSNTDISSSSISSFPRRLIEGSSRHGITEGGNIEAGGGLSTEGGNILVTEGGSIEGAGSVSADGGNMSSGKSQCEFESIPFEQKKSSDAKMVAMKKGLFDEIMEFQQRSRGGRETLAELMALPSRWKAVDGGGLTPKITVILNHYKRKTLCAQLEALLGQTLPFYNVWVLAFGSPNENKLRSIVEAYNDSRISFVSSSYDFKYYGRFQIAMQVDEADYVYILDDDMIPGRKMLHILSHAARTIKYGNSVFGSIGRVLPFRQKDFSFPSYRKYGSKEAGLYLPDPAYGITVDRMVEVDFLSSSWFLSAQLVKTIFVETPFTFSTGEDLHLSYQLQKYRDASSFVLPIDPADKDTWGDSEHRLAYISETTVIFKDVVQVRDDQWWRTLVRGYVTQWAAMHPQTIDTLIYAHSLDEVSALAPLLHRFRSVPGRKALLVVTGGTFCPCEEAAKILGWGPSACHERRFKILDLEVGSIDRHGASHVPIVQEVLSSMKGLLKIFSPALVITVDDVASIIKEVMTMAITKNGANTTSLVLLPRRSIPYSLWIPDVRLGALQRWNKMKISINIITQNRAYSLKRLLDSISNAYFLGDEISISFNVDSQVDVETLNMANNFNWSHGGKHIRRRIVQGGLIRAVSESWYPSSDDDFGLLLEDDIEVSPFFYMWLKYALLAYHYDPLVSLPELSSIALYTPRLVEVVKERPRWNPTEAFKSIHPNTPYLHQLPCSWGALFFPKHWREFYTYMGARFTQDAKQNPVQIPKSRTNGWQASWKKFLIDMMYLRGYVALYPNFPNQTSFSTNHMEPGAHIAASGNVVTHKKEDFAVPLLQEDFHPLLPSQKMPPASHLPVINLFNQPTSLKGLKSSGAKLGQDVLECGSTEIVTVDPISGRPLQCSQF